MRLPSGATNSTPDPSWPANKRQRLRPVDLASRSPHFWATLDADSVRPYLPDLPILLPVASFQRRDYQLKRPPRLALHSAPVAVDTGAFAWLHSFTTYHFSAPQFAEWIDGVRPPVSWAVIPDRPTEDLCGPQEVRRAQAETTEAIVHVLETLLDVPWAWTPVLQGRTVEDYLRHAVELAGILYDLAAVYRKRGLTFRVGLGSICRRGQASEIHRIVASVATVLPGIPLHLFGAKVDVLNRWGNRPQTVVSCDSAAWNGRFGTDIPFINAERRRLGLSQREYGLQIALPRYATRVEATFSQTLLSLA
jgi:hypothetical protein